MNQVRNQVVLIGHLGADPEIRDYDNGKKMARVSLATNEYYKNADGEKLTTTQWHNCVGWGKMAELMAQLLEKGKEVALQGKLNHRNYEDDLGNKRQFTEIIISDFVLLGGKKVEEV
jgi:single-strand DNA-binding protein